MNNDDKIIKKTAIIITGAPCSGKTTLCNKLSKDLDINFVNENNSGNLFGILNNLYTQKNFLIIEHSDILNYLEEIRKIFNKIIIIYLDVSDELLNLNYNERIKNNAIGDFKNIDIFEIKRELDEIIETMNFDTIFKIKINDTSDYENKYRFIKDIIIENKNNIIK